MSQKNYNKTTKTTKVYLIKRDFVFEGQNVYAGDMLVPERYVTNQDVETKLTGLLHRGFLVLDHEIPKSPEPVCCPSELIKQELSESQDYEIQPDQPEVSISKSKTKRKTKDRDISLIDQQLVDEANRILG